MSGAPTSQIAASIVQAVGLINQGQWGLAERVLGQVLGVAPREPDGLQLMGVVRAAQGRNGEAEALYRRSLAAKPKQPHVQVNLGKLLVGMGRPQDGIAMLRAVARANPAYVDALLVLGQAQQAAGDLAFAEKNLRAALKLEPGHASAILSLGALLNDASRPAEGEAVLRPALALDLPADLRAAIEQNLAVALKLQNRHGEALALFDAALRHAPGLPLADANRANTLQHLGRQEEAVAGYRKALAKDPLHLSAHQELNALLYRMGRDEDFLKSFDDAAVRAPEAALLWLGKGGFLNRTERFAEARDCFARAARAAPDNPEAQNGWRWRWPGWENWTPRWRPTRPRSGCAPATCRRG
ncbi:MAG: tetratricopeptide repeat protein [Rhizomicrobium sp.]